ncbi:uncharacterized protein IAS62_001802 [Cryptococcus decagattii]|uniref:K Homology domain-containing protein n=1 Tax=Cryptococcus decagattii TaxID=1859122 RepID=A0ABZ2AVD5_9TREE
MDLYTTSFTYPILQSNSHQSSGSPKISLSSPIPTTGPGPGSIIISANASGTSCTANKVLNNDIDPSIESAPELPVTAAISSTSTIAKPTSAVVASPPQVEKDWETVQKLALDITTREGCLVTVTRECVDGGSRSGPSEPSTTNGGTPVPATTVWNFHLSGGYQPVMAARGAILRETPQDNRVTLKVPRSEILDSPAASVSSLKADVCRRLEKIALESKAQVSVISIEVSAGGGPTVLATTNGEGVRSTEVKSEAESKLTDAATDVADAKTNGEEESCVSSITTPYVTRSLGLETERMCELVITGSMESVEVAKICLLVMLDEMSGLHAESCDIDYKLHNIIAGRKRNVIQQIQEETATNIYFPTPLVGVLNSPQPGFQQEQGMLGKSNQIWITGEFFGVQRARDMLLNIAMQKCKLVISRDTAILPRKLDWLLTQKIEDVKTIMNDNGTYIQVPSVGSQASLITVFGDHRVNIERTIRGVMALACQFYVASVWLLPVTFDVFMPQPTLNPAQMQPILKRIAHSSGAEVVFKSNCFEMHGLEQQVKAAVMMVLEQDIVHNFHREIRFQIELANEHRDFISGKKNGKINKIMKTANVKIKFETFNDYNFLIDISGTDGDALKGLSMLQEELPAEVSFHVPESYHKRIIGVSGKNIQKIMKLHGVYVKFSNAEEFAALGGYTDNEDNVVARTPAKNAVNLESLKQAVMELVSQKDKDYTVESVTIPRRYHRTLLGEKGIFIHDIETKTNSVFRFPYKETASDVVTIFGPESQVHIAAAMLLDHVPFEADLPVPPNPELSRLMTSADFILFTERVKRDHQIAIVPSPKLGLGNEAIFKFRCQRSNVDFLGTAIDALEDWLSQNKIQIYPKNANRRPESFTDAFSHFNSKLLSTKNNTELDGDSDRRIKQTAASVVATEDVRALFNGPGNSFGLGDESNLGLVSSLNYQDPRKGADRWPGSIPQQPPVTGRTESDHQKRDSDPIINDHIRQASTGHSSSLSTHLHPHSRPRISSNRHQSLDISQLNFSRALTGGPSAFGPMPLSPTAANSSPNTATAPYFPHVGPHPIRANVTGRGGYGSASSADVESVAQTMSNVQLSHQ